MGHGEENVRVVPPWFQTNFFVLSPRADECRRSDKRHDTSRNRPRALRGLGPTNGTQRRVLRDVRDSRRHTRTPGKELIMGYGSLDLDEMPLQDITKELDRR